MKKLNDKKIFLFFTIITVFIVTFSIGANTVFGSKTDWLAQHITLPDYFRKLFYETKDLFPNFAFNIGGGQNIFYFSYYGLLSPYVLLSYFFPFVPMGVYLMILNVLIVIISGFLAYKFLRNNNFEERTSLVAATLFLLINSFIFHAHRHIMFVNYLPFLILALMGVDNYFNNKKSTLLVISTFLMIMTSYYFSVGGLLVILIYGIYKYLAMNKKITVKDFFIDGFKFLGRLFIAIMLSGILLIPTALLLVNGKMGMNTTINWSKLFIPFLNIDGLLYNNYGIGYTAITLIALLYSLFSKRREAIFLSIMILIFSSFPILVTLLNGMLYFRSKVLIPFAPLFLLPLASFFDQIKSEKINYHYLAVIIFIILGSAFSQGLFEEVLFDILIVILLLLYSKKTRQLTLFYTVTIIFALLVNVRVNKNEKYPSVDDYKEVFSPRTSKQIKEILAEDKSFYRFNNLVGNTYNSVNTIYDINYYQTSTYSSVSNYNYYNFFNNVFSNPVVYRNNFILAQESNIAFQTLMGVKYIRTTNEKVPIGYELVKQDGNIGIYKNENVFPLGYVTSNLLSERTFDELTYPYNVLALLENAVINKDVNNNFSPALEKVDLKYNYQEHDKIKIKEENNTYTINVDEAAALKLMLEEVLKGEILFIKFRLQEAPPCSFGDIAITINGVRNKLTCREWLYFNENYQFEYVISSPDEIDYLNIYFSRGHFRISEIEVYKLDYSYLKNIKNEIDPFIVDVNRTKGDQIVGNIDVTKDGYFVTTIPYDEGFTIKVNNEIIEYEQVNNAFIGFPLAQGSYEIEFQYRAKGFELGLFSSIIGLGLLSLVVFLERRKND